MKKLFALTSAFVLVFGFVAVASAEGDAAKEVSTAQAHAAMAQGSDSVDMAHTHLHHVINCLVGPDDEAFDAGAGNPCKGQGNGAIPDAQGNEALTTKLENALDHAQAGLQEDALDAVQQQAAKASAALAATPEEQASGGYSW